MKRLITSLFSAAALLFGVSGSVSADIVETEATLLHTAAVQGGSNASGKTLDAETHHYNMWGTTGWVAQAYIGFSFTIPEGHVVSEATLGFSSMGAKNYKLDINYIDGTDFDYNAIELVAWGNSGTNIATIDDPKGSFTLKTIDATAAVKALYAAESNSIVFVLGGSQGSGDFYGAGAETGKPTLTIKTLPKSELTSYTVNFLNKADNGVLKEAVAHTEVIPGSVVNATEEEKAEIEVEGKKYLFASADALTTTGDAEKNQLNVYFNEATTYTVKYLRASDKAELKTAKVYEDVVNGQEVAASDEDKADITYEGVRYVFGSTEGKTIVLGEDNVIEVLFNAVTTYTVKYVELDNVENNLKEAKVYNNAEPGSTAAASDDDKATIEKGGRKYVFVSADEITLSTNAEENVILAFFKEMTTYTVKYLLDDEETELKDAVVRDGVPGEAAAATDEDKAAFSFEDVRYVCVEVKDIEALSSNAEENVIELIFKEASKYMVKYVLNGDETTELKEAQIYKDAPIGEIATIEESDKADIIAANGRKYVYDHASNDVLVMEDVEDNVIYVYFNETDKMVATLVHTAAVQGGSNAAGTSLDTETHYYNNWGVTSWAAQAYIGFSLENVPAGYAVSKAELTFLSHCGGKYDGRVIEICYRDGGEIEYDKIALAAKADCGVAIGSVTDNRTDQLKTVDVTKGVRDLLKRGANEIVFTLAGAAAGGTLYGAASENRPVLTLTTVEPSKLTNYTVRFYDFETDEEFREPVVYEGVEIGTTASITDEDKAAYYTTDGKKYMFESAMQIVLNADAAQNVIEAYFNEIPKVSYVVKNKIDDEETVVAERETFDGESVTAYFTQYKLIGTTLYSAPKQSGAYWGKTQVISSDNEDNEIVIEYAATDIENVAYYKEAEDIPGATMTDQANAPVRCSGGKGGFFTERTTLTTLQPGKYKITAGGWGNSGTFFDIFTTEDDHEATLTVELNGNVMSATSEEFEITEPTRVWVEAAGNENRMLDYIYIVKTDGPVEQPTTIMTVESESEDGSIYDLSGKKVMNPTKGLFIKGGKLIMVK
ncbi:MAG: hypothetical protein II951_06040 [Bacteroidales bacterium]|nr:hypothetical protein [Bacteroidales bacterium]